MLIESVESVSQELRVLMDADRVPAIAPARSAQADVFRWNGLLRITEVPSVSKQTSWHNVFEFE